MELFSTLNAIEPDACSSPLNSEMADFEWWSSINPAWHCAIPNPRLCCLRVFAYSAKPRSEEKVARMFDLLEAFFSDGIMTSAKKQASWGLSDCDEARAG